MSELDVPASGLVIKVEGVEKARVDGDGIAAPNLGGGGGSVAWEDVTGKPSTFPPDSHSHPELPTTGQKNALAGANGTPGTNNEYLTKQSIGSGGSAGKALAADDVSTTNARPPILHIHSTAEVTDLDAALAGKAASSHTHPTSQVTGLDAALTGKQDASAKGQANGYASLDGAGKVPAAQIPTGGGGFSWDAVLRQAADATQAVVGFANSANLTFPFVANGVYAVELYLLMRSNLATAGFRLALDTSVAVTSVALQFGHVLANTGTFTAGQSRADATATGLSSGVDTINVDIPVFGHGILVAGASPGTATLAFGPEVAATATLKANSIMRVHKVA